MSSELDGVSVDIDRHTALLSLENVSISYENSQLPVVSNVHFQLHKGESVLFMGPSGSGKSTLAMLCAQIIPRSIEASTQGEIWFSPEILDPGSVGYVFQDPDSQFCMLQVADDVAFGLENQGVQRALMDARISHALIESGLDIHNDDHHALFSGGMKQKLAIACALAMEPKLLIFDEPTANLDPKSTHQVFLQIAKLHKAKQTMIVIEHKFDSLIPLMDRVVLFDRTGKIYRTGDTETVLCQEWQWLISEGIVAPWKQPPVTCKNKFPIYTYTNKTELIKEAADHHSINPILDLQNVSFRYGKKPIFTNLSMRIRKGSFVAIVGPNGAGKSTLLQMLGGLLKNSSGEISLLGRPLRSWSNKEKYSTIAYSFQNPEYQFIYERVGDELANQIVGDNVPEDVLDILSTYGLNGLDQQSPYALSQGQKRRLSVATMLRIPHELYLFDEPTFGQDAHTQEAILEKMHSLHQLGKTIIISTHDMDLVRRYADDVLVVVQGELAFQGSPHNLFLHKDLLEKAHLLDDIAKVITTESNPSSLKIQGMNQNSYTVDLIHHSEGHGRHLAPIHYVHPAWFFLSMFLATTVALFAHTLAESIAELVLPILVMMGLAWMSPWKILKLTSPFLIFYLLYIWSFLANSAVPPGVAAYHFLWYRISWYGLNQGLIISTRMLGSVLFGILFVTKVDITDFMVGMTKSFRVPPKFAYGTMAGIRVIPLFTTEWVKLRQARQVRGKDSRHPIFRPVTYALPLLSQGIRMSERVAIAMEARGFFDKVAASAKNRTFYRKLSVRWWDFALNATLILLAIAGIIFL